MGYVARLKLVVFIFQLGCVKIGNWLLKSSVFFEHLRRSGHKQAA